jgi:hypothetical protein
MEVRLGNALQELIERELPAPLWLDYQGSFNDRDLNFGTAMKMDVLGY